MFSRQSFFPSIHQHSHSDTLHFSNVVKTNQYVSETYRGFDQIPRTMFHLPTLVLGLFGREFPDILTMDHVIKHKTSNYAEKHILVSLSVNKELAEQWGNGNYITVDMALFREFSVDIHRSYAAQSLVLPARMEKEKEHATLLVLYSSIRSITMLGKEILNPFYLKINPDNIESNEAYKAVYLQLITLLRNKYKQQMSPYEEQAALESYAAVYLKLYETCCGPENPFNKTLKELTQQYPDFMHYFNDALGAKLSLMAEDETLGDRIIIDAKDALKDHVYGKSINVPSRITDYEASCYSDPWAGNVYD